MNSHFLFRMQLIQFYWLILLNSTLSFDVNSNFLFLQSFFSSTYYHVHFDIVVISLMNCLLLKLSSNSVYRQLTVHQKKTTWFKSMMLLESSWKWDLIQTLFPTLFKSHFRLELSGLFKYIFFWFCKQLREPWHSVFTHSVLSGRFKNKRCSWACQIKRKILLLLAFQDSYQPRPLHNSWITLSVARVRTCENSLPVNK